MTPGGRHDELGAKVRRAQEALDSVRGIGTVDDVTVEVGADNTITAIDGPPVVDRESVLEAYRIALRDKQPRVDNAMREVLEDERLSQISTFTDAHARREAAQPESADHEDHDWEQIQQDPLGYNRDW